jgi:internalin A
MTITFNCPACQKIYHVADNLEGKTSRCGCGHQFEIPAQAEPTPSVAPQLVAPQVPPQTTLANGVESAGLPTPTSPLGNSGSLLAPPAQSPIPQSGYPEWSNQPSQTKLKDSKKNLIVITSLVLLLITGGITVFFLASGDDVANSASIAAVPTPDVTSSVPEDDNNTRAIGEAEGESQSSTMNVSGAAVSDESNIVENSIGIKLVKIPPLPVGSGATPFYISAFEVTQSQYEEIMGEFKFPFADDNKPAHHIRWNDAEEFCRRLSDLPIEKNAGRRYRLPRGKEWIHACRAGKNTRYSFGDDESLLVKHAVFGRTLKDGPLQVGTKLPNPWGLYDMHGNVWEWCLDQRTLSSGEVDEIRRNNPEQLGRDQTEVIFKRHCGGSWHVDSGMLHWNVSGGNQPHGNILDCGIRLVMESSGSGPSTSSPNSVAQTKKQVVFGPERRFTLDQTDAYYVISLIDDGTYYGYPLGIKLKLAVMDELGNVLTPEIRGTYRIEGDKISFWKFLTSKPNEVTIGKLVNDNIQIVDANNPIGRSLIGQTFVYRTPEEFVVFAKDLQGGTGNLIRDLPTFSEKFMLAIARGDRQRIKKFTYLDVPKNNVPPLSDFPEKNSIIENVWLTDGTPDPTRETRILQGIGEFVRSIQKSGFDPESAVTKDFKKLDNYTFEHTVVDKAGVAIVIFYQDIFPTVFGLRAFKSPELKAVSNASPSESLAARTKPRLWKNLTGDFHLGAILSRIDGEQVLLKEVGIDGKVGKEYSVPIGKLSENDQNYVTIMMFGGEVKVERNNLVQYASFGKNSELTDDGLARLGKITSLQHLEIRGTQLTDAGLVHLKTMGNLVYLDLLDSQIGDDGLKSLVELRKLQKLNLVSTQITDDGLKHISGMTNLSLLALANTAITSAGLAHIRELDSLNQLFLHSTAVDDMGLVHLRQLVNLKELYLFDTNVTEAGVRRLQQAIPNCKIIHTTDMVPPPRTRLKLHEALEFVERVGGKAQLNGAQTEIISMDFSKSNISDDDLEYLVGYRRIGFLNLSDTQISDEGLEHLKAADSIGFLFLDGTKVTDEGMIHLKNHKELTVLGLHNTRITDKGLAHLKELPRLAQLMVHKGTKVTEAGLVHLKSFPALTALSLDKANFSEASLAELRRALPNCRITH